MYRIEASIPECTLAKTGTFTLCIDTLLRRFSIPTANPITLFVPHLSIHSSLAFLHARDKRTLHKLSVTVGDFLPELQGTLDQWFRMESALNESGSDGDASSTLNIHLLLQLTRLDSQAEDQPCLRCQSYQKRLRSYQLEVESLTHQLRTYPVLQGELESLRIGALSLTSPQSLTQQEKDYVRYALGAMEEKAKLADLLQREAAGLQEELKTTFRDMQEQRTISEETVIQLNEQFRRVMDDLKRENQEKGDLTTALTQAKAQLSVKIRAEQDLNAQLQLTQKQLTVKTAQALLYSQAEFENSELKVALGQADERNKRLTEEVRKLGEEMGAKMNQFELQSVVWTKERETKEEELKACRELLAAKTHLADQLLSEKSKIEGQIHFQTQQFKAKEDFSQQIESLEKRLKTSEELRAKINAEIPQSLEMVEAELGKMGKEREVFIEEREKLHVRIRALEQEFGTQVGLRERLEIETDEQAQHIAVLEQALCDQEHSHSLLASLVKAKDQSSVLTLELVSEVDSLSDRLLRHSEKILAGQQVIARLAEVVEKQNCDLHVIRKMFRSQGPYSAVEGDGVDEVLAKYLNERLIPPPVPFRREESGVYLFGAKRVAIKVEQGRLIVRVGGGYMGIEDFIVAYSSAEIEKLENRRSDKSGDPFILRLSQYFDSKSANTSLKLAHSSSQHRRRSPP